MTKVKATKVDYKIQNYEKGNLEVDCAGVGIDTDGTGDYARSDELHVGKCKKEMELPFGSSIFEVKSKKRKMESSLYLFT